MLQLQIADALNAMPDVFSTVQWGGRAYKIPGPGSRGLKKPLLLAHVWLNDSPHALCVSFKLPPDRAARLVHSHAFLAPHAFRTLAPAGWVTATITSARDYRSLIKLLQLSRAQFPRSSAPVSSQAPSTNHAPPASASSPVARRIIAVMDAFKSKGWSPPPLDDLPPHPSAASPARTITPSRTSNPPSSNSSRTRSTPRQRRH